MSKPLLLDYVCERSGDINPAYVYSRMKDMNVIKTSGGDLPFIEADHALADVHTQTRIQKETEDNDNYMNELVTKTNARRERDDEVVNCWAELLTKTDMVKERDDETLMELISKTRNGMITYCAHCRVYHLEFGNLFFRLSEVKLVRDSATILRFFGCISFAFSNNALSIIAV